MGDVVDMFTRQPIPAAEGSDFVQEFSENELGDLYAAIESLTRSEDEEQFRYYLKDIQEQAAGWNLSP